LQCRRAQLDAPVSIRLLKRAAADFRPGAPLFTRAAPSGQRVAVVGAGPAGLACAHRLAMLGHAVMLFDAQPKLGGLNEYGLATYKTVDGFAQKEIDWLLSIGGIEVKPQHRLGRDMTLEALVRDFDAVFLGLGLAGVYFLIGPGGQTDWIGVLLVLIAIVGYTIELVAIQWYLSAYDIRTVTLYVLGGMATAITLAWLALGADRDGFGAPALAASLLLGALCTYFGWWAMFTAIRQLGTAQVALLSPFEVLLSIIWSFLWLGERFTSFQLVGAGLILVSASLAMQRRRRPAPDPSP